VKLIGVEEKERLYEHYLPRLVHSRKSEIYGCCIKLLTDDEVLRRTWEDNFYAASESTRSHGRLIALRDPGQEDGVLYDPYTRTAFSFNLEYYGWIKSLALAIAGDTLEDEHEIYSVHGAAIDVGGRGVALIAPPKTGKTTHSWGLLRMPEARLITDDWFFVRLSEKGHLAFGSEKNCYVDGNIAGIWPEYRPLVEKAKFDDAERAILNVRWIIGNTGVIPMTSLRTVLLLKRDETDEALVSDLTVDEAMEYLERNDFRNPHQLVRDERKSMLRRQFFRQLLSKVDVHMVNTRLPPEQTQEEIRRTILA
jgi:hypothetical protein